MLTRKIPLKLLQEANEVISNYYGITFNNTNMSVLDQNIHNRMKQLNIDDPKEYIVMLYNNDIELTKFINLTTNNLTFFFRAPIHFDILRDIILPNFMKKNKDTIRVWSAGCSTGEEPYSIAMFISNYFNKFNINKDIKIIASDVNIAALIKAKDGVYKKQKLEKFEKEDYIYYVEEREDKDVYYIKDNLKKMIEFHLENLMGSVHKDIDVIFCRNVFIYFDQHAQEHILQNFYNSLAPNSYLLMGLSESIREIEHPFQFIKQGKYHLPMKK